MITLNFDLLVLHVRYLWMSLRKRSLEVTEAILVSAVVKLVVLGTQFCHQQAGKESSWEHFVVESHKIYTSNNNQL